MSAPRSSFSVKSSHRFVKPKAEDTSVFSTDSSGFFQTAPTPTYSHGQQVPTAGSARGMSVRTTTTAVEDFY